MQWREPRNVDRNQGLTYAFVADKLFTSRSIQLTKRLAQVSGAAHVIVIAESRAGGMDRPGCH